MSSKLKKILGNGAFLLFCMGITAYFVLRGQDFDTLVTFMQSSSQVFWLGGFALVVAFILSESLIIYYLMKTFGDTPKLSHCFLYSFVGFFFSLVTPTASGGQPMQLLFMKRDGLSMSRAVIALLLVTITYKSVLVLVGIVVLIFQPANIMSLLEPAIKWIWLGMALNVICVGAMVFLVFSPHTAQKIASFCLKIAGKFAGAKRVESWQAKVQEGMSRYSEASIYVRKHTIVIVQVFLMTIVQRCLLFAVTYLVLLSFSIHVLSLAETVLIQGSISLSADMLPLPGGLGISEHLYTLIFDPICGETLTTLTLIVSRGLSFYAQLFTSAVFTVVAYFVVFGKKKETKQ